MLKDVAALTWLMFAVWYAVGHIFMASAMLTEEVWTRLVC